LGNYLPVEVLVMDTRPDTRKTYGNGRLRTLSARLTPDQQAARQRKIVARATVAERLAYETAVTRLLLAQHTQRGFFARLKWLVVGK
jgi:hypothetical protein